jgi:Uncharacterized protein involved in cytokinesis, contains TGc (transglutaminase/protease-like) domain
MEKKNKGLAILLVITQVVLLVGIGGLFYQNRSLAQTVKEYVAGQGEVHDIYDDTAVVKAYKSGDDSNLGEQDKYVLKKAQEVIKANIKKGMTAYEKEKAIYDWQVAYVAFSDDSMAPITNGSQYNYLPYGVLKYHNAICVGNATTFKLFMDILGIDCKIIHSTENGEHAWDVVKLDDDWYHVDVTFDGGNNGKPGYNYFNVPDSVKDDGSYPWNHDEIPAADGVKYCYVYHNAGNLADVYAVPKYVKQQIKKGSTLISFTLKDNSGYTSETSEYITSALSTDSGAYYSGNVMNDNNQGVNEVSGDDAYVSGGTAGTYSVSTGSVYAIGGKTIYTMSVVYNESGSGNTDNSDKIISKLQEIINGLQ